MEELVVGTIFCPPLGFLPDLGIDLMLGGVRGARTHAWALLQSDNGPYSGEGLITSVFGTFSDHFSTNAAVMIPRTDAYSPPSDCRQVFLQLDLIPEEATRILIGLVLPDGAVSGSIKVRLYPTTDSSRTLAQFSSSSEALYPMGSVLEVLSIVRDDSRENWGVQVMERTYPGGVEALIGVHFH